MAITAITITNIHVVVALENKSPERGPVAASAACANAPCAIIKNKANVAYLPVNPDAFFLLVAKSFATNKNVLLEI